MDVARYIEDIESRLDPVQEEKIERAWLSWARHENADGPFSPPSRHPSPSKLEWRHVYVNDAFADDDLMALSQMERLHNTLASGSSSPLFIRPNYGVGNVATMFGAPLFMMDRDMDTLPNVRSLGGERAARIAKEPLPEHTAGNGEKIFRMAERFAQIRAKYPKIARFVRLEQPDFQGPMDNCELLWGSDVFYALYDDPEAVHALLDRLTDFLDGLVARWREMFPRTDGTTSYFRHIETGGVAIRDDSAMNLSPEMFRQFIAPYDGRLLAKYGGVVHFCGRGDHFIDALGSLPGLNGVNMSQPHLNEMEKILSATVDRGINLSVPRVELGGHNAARAFFA